MNAKASDKYMRKVMEHLAYSDAIKELSKQLMCPRLFIFIDARMRGVGLKRAASLANLTMHEALSVETNHHVRDARDVAEFDVSPYAEKLNLEQDCRVKPAR